jgi:type IV fimbrial biogenesis protein FimT
MEDAGRSGFTLVELLVTLAVVALLVTVAVTVAAPAMARFLDKARLRAATQTLAQELRQARNHALSHQSQVHFSVSVRAQQWCFGWRDDSACRCDSHAGAAQCRTANDGRMHTQSSADFPAVQLTASQHSTHGSVVFSPLRGTATGTAFVLRNDYAEARVIVSPLGRIRICSPDGRSYPSC